MIELRNVSKTYWTKSGANVVLDRVSLSIKQGENLAILGFNGAGKSTLLRLIGGAELPDQGEITRNGNVSWPIGFGGGFNGSLTGEENCRFVARIYGQDIDEVIDATRDFADIGDYFFMPVRTYSSGMRARLAFGVSMTLDFDAYLVDEVTAVGDRRFRKKCQKAFAQKGKTSSLIMVSHQIDTLREYCQKCALLNRGELRLFDSLDDAFTAYENLQ